MPVRPDTNTVPPTGQVNLQQVAEYANVSVSTASRCLRGDTRFTTETRRRVETTAHALGYRPDPMLRALVAYRTRKKRAPVRAGLAWLHPYKGGLRKAPVPRHRLLSMFAGARQRAEALGYRLVEMALPDEAAVPAVQRIIAARGIEGAVLCSVRRSPVCTGFDFSRIAAVSVGYPTGEQPDFPTIVPHYFRGAVRALDELRRRSGRRIGLALFDDTDVHTDHLIHSAFAYMREVRPEIAWTPALIRRERWKNCIETFREWYLEHRPDSILTNEWRIIHVILRQGHSVPGDVNVVLTDIAHPTAVCGGIYENAQTLGVCAINQLDGMIRQREFGLPERIQHTFVENPWMDGPTIRPLADATPEELARRAEALCRFRQMQVPPLPRKSFARHLPDIGYGYGVPAPVRV
ncbi:MAG: LacI family DNA-binding transcriptional regulator [Opitutaceae bacterium]|nr:LacI family DNA-binding transcriptional regulator [Opitutaceae bacterium]